ncbi:2,5-dihydroxypyridine 5,6-dioxygenase [Anaerolineae bacterium]|nr:2,5-dihydroxypyridine 5,6-dioxygenase [Anaerolineae bacterium]
MDRMINPLPVLSLMPQARTIIRDCLKLKPGEQLAILWDETVSPELVQAARIAAQELGAYSSLVVYEPLTYRPIEEFCHFAGRSLKEQIPVPPMLLGCMQAADASLLFMSDMEMTLSPSFQEVLGNRKRILVIPYLDSATARRILFNRAEQVNSLCREVQYYGEMLERGKVAKLCSAEGSELTIKLGQWQARCGTGVPGPGEIQILPGGQVTRIPNDDSMEGTLVVDRTIAARYYKELHESIRLHIKKGQVIAVEGGTEAKILREFLDDQADPRAFHVTELGIGLNPLCRLGRLAALGEDTHARGTVSLALGCDTHLGGGTPGPFHVDMTMRFPSLSIDGRDIIQDGRLVQA